MPNNCLFLVDTFDTISGIKNAIIIAKHLCKNGHKFLGIRLDSGDLAYLSKMGRNMLDKAGFTEAKILASNELDEHIINSLNQQGATICAFGVGTNLVTGGDQAALGGVYKLAAIRDPGSDWRYCVKISEQTIKITTPGICQIRRFRTAHEYIADMIYDEQSPPKAACGMIDPMDFTRRKNIAADTKYNDLLAPIFRSGKLVYKAPTTAHIKEHVQEQLDHFHAGIKRLINAHTYPVGLELGLYETRTKLIMQARGVS